MIRTALALTPGRWNAGTRREPEASRTRQRGGTSWS